MNAAITLLLALALHTSPSPAVVVEIPHVAAVSSDRTETGDPASTPVRADDSAETGDDDPTDWLVAAAPSEAPIAPDRAFPLERTEFRAEGVTVRLLRPPTR